MFKSNHNVHIKCSTKQCGSLLHTSSSSCILARKSRIRASFSASRSRTFTSSSCRHLMRSSFWLSISCLILISSRDDCREVCCIEHTVSLNVISECGWESVWRTFHVSKWNFLKQQVYLKQGILQRTLRLQAYGMWHRVCWYIATNTVEKLATSICRIEQWANWRFFATLFPHLPFSYDPPDFLLTT